MSDVLSSPGAVGGKAALKSKTLWAALITVILPFIPVIGPFFAAQPQLVGVATGAVFAILRLVTADRIRIG